MNIRLSKRKLALLAGCIGLVSAFALLVYMVHPYWPKGRGIEPLRKAVGLAEVGRLARKNPNKVLLIGVDGATWKVIDPLIRRGRLPNLQKLIREGVRGPLESLPISKSPTIWTTMLTGVLPERHGVNDFLIDGNPPRSYHRKVPALWNMLGDAKTCAFIGFWATWPPEAVNGIMVSDFLGLQSDFDRSGEFKDRQRNLTYPAGFLEEIERKGLRPGREKLENEFYERFTKGRIPEEEAEGLFGQWLAWYATIYWQDILFQGIAEYVLDRSQPDLTAVYSRGVDSVQHVFWFFHEPEAFGGAAEEFVDRYGGVIDEYNVLQDQWIKVLCRLIDKDTTVVIASDHGFKPRPREEFRKGEKTSGYYLSGIHDIEGVLILTGPPIKKGYEIRAARVQDIAPTILYLLGLPVPENLDGRVLTEALKERYKLFHPIYTVSEYPMVSRTGRESRGGEIEKMDEMAKEQLRALGYIR